MNPAVSNLAISLVAMQGLSTLCCAPARALLTWPVVYPDTVSVRPLLTATCLGMGLLLLYVQTETEMVLRWRGGYGDQWRGRSRSTTRRR